ncbi:MAG: tRNA (adenosine(37)-N6)-dimethylallyltransferase MiaA [Eubacteriales bacterium]|nr:tRNA (adenosine(37)-N6)-dimethylallyltransferase MiaA [Eubacteriales bacterium]
MEQRKEKPKLVIIAGPTAVGKTSAAVRLAQKIGGEVVSADSMQVYRGMDIGTAKVTEEEMQGIPHHLIDIIEPEEDYNVVRFQAMAKAAITDIISRGKIPILCGGTGFYIQALLYEIDFTKEENAGDEALRDTLLAEAKEEAARRGDTDGGAAYLHAQLASVDPEAAAAIPPANMKRVLRALEFYRLHGKKISDHNAEQAERKQNAPYDYRFFVLTDDRKKLYERIDKRVDLMMEAGLLREAEALRARGIPSNATSMQGIGYRELMRYFNSEYTLDEAVSAIKQNSRHYAKRQLTWFRREENVIWIDIGETENVLAEMEKYLWKE